MISRILLGMMCCAICGCSAQVTPETAQLPPLEALAPDTLPFPPEVVEYIAANRDNGQPSISVGEVSQGMLVNGKLLPWQGKNYHYFSEESYLGGRAFVNDRVRDALIATYDQMDPEVPGRQFRMMESSNEQGGQMWPHRTHQNGLSIDLMVPLLRHQQPYYALDTLGSAHYGLSFDNHGRLVSDSAVSIDFDLIARHIILLETEAGSRGLSISKVIFKLELKDELFATPHGKKLKASGIYFAQNLSPLINSLHDDHYHVDFEPVRKFDSPE
jgi:penicillin-insensitive murein endopeptidase